MEKLTKIKVEKHSDDGISDDEPQMNYYLPSFEANDLQIPEVADWEVGGTYRLMVEVTMESKSDTGKSVNGNFKIEAYKDVTKKDVKDMDDDEFSDHVKEQRGGSKY